MAVDCSPYYCMVDYAEWITQRHDGIYGGRVGSVQAVTNQARMTLGAAGLHGCTAREYALPLLTNASIHRFPC